VGRSFHDGRFCPELGGLTALPTLAAPTIHLVTGDSSDPDRGKTRREVVGQVVGVAFAVAILCNLVATFDFEGLWFLVVRLIAGAVFVVSAIAWLVMWAADRRAKPRPSPSP
jgi:hypothetical protein